MYIASLSKFGAGKDDDDDDDDKLSYSQPKTNEDG
jgi:hypothetical protein